MSENTSYSASGGTSWLIIFVVIGLIAVFLAVTNPSEQQMEKRIAAEGWVPVRLQHHNFLVFRSAEVVGITGARATYYGCLGQIWYDK
jgi:uncharacterized membrane protein